MSDDLKRLPTNQLLNTNPGSEEEPPSRIAQVLIGVIVVGGIVGTFLKVLGII